MRTRVALLFIGVAVMLLAACGEEVPMASPDEDIEGTWELTEGSGPDGSLNLVDGHSVTLTYDGEQLGGRAACNSYGAELVREDGSVRIEVGGMTAMGCEPAVMDLESAYIDVLGTVDSVVRDGDALSLTGPDTELHFVMVPPVPTAEMVGTTWVLETLIESETASSTMGEATLVLSEDGTLTAATGCREFVGRYVETGGEILVPESEARGECTEDLRAQDDHVVTVLGDGFRASVEGDQLTLTSQGGLGLVYRAS